MSISDNAKMRVFAMKLHTGKDFKPVRVAATIVKDFDIYADGCLVTSVRGNFRSLVKIPMVADAKEVQIHWLATNGADAVHLFSADILPQ